MLLSCELGIHLDKSYNMEEDNQPGRYDNNHRNTSRKYHFNPMSITLFEHFYTLLSEKKINIKIILL